MKTPLCLFQSNAIRNVSRKFLLTISWLLYFVKALTAQTPQVNFDAHMEPSKLAGLQRDWGANKKIPEIYKEQVLIALSFFPELKKTNIVFRIRHVNAPLATRPTNAGIFKASGKRPYIITISDSSIKMLSPILFKKMPFNAQVGVIGHELSHVADFSAMRPMQLIGLGIKHVSSKFLDRFEYKTDSICIAHGLGFQLLSWSEFIRQALSIKGWEGSDKLQPKDTAEERYMNPGTIMKFISSNKLYSQISNR